MTRKYLLIQCFKKPMPEHAAIENNLRSQASDVKLAFTAPDNSGGGVVGYLFTTDAPLRDLAYGPLMNEDRLLVVELGDRCLEQGMNVATAWIRSHRGTTD